MIKFLTQPKNFKEPHDTTGYNIEAVGINIPNQEFTSDDNMSLEFCFFKKVDGEFFEYSRVLKPDVYKKVTIPGMGDIDFIAGLMSYNKANVYGVAQLFSAQYGYTLLPLAEQIDLNLL